MVNVGPRLVLRLAGHTAASTDLQNERSLLTNNQVAEVTSSTPRSLTKPLMKFSSSFTASRSPVPALHNCTVINRFCTPVEYHCTTGECITGFVHLYSTIVQQVSVLLVLYACTLPVPGLHLSCSAQHPLTPVMVSQLQIILTWTKSVDIQRIQKE